MDGSLPPPSLRQQRAAETRQTVLKAAQAAFELKGFTGVDIRTIARSAGLSTGAIFAHFASKAALYEAATGKTAPTAATVDASPEMFIALKCLVGLVQLVRSRDDCPAEIRKELTEHWRLQEALDAIAIVEGR